ncbi:SPASM domain-containing protein [Butyrivibrio sp. INlla16]|uniref:SPASM domain-containing protein n=1 Tax=Butyrivibrio sp. INlla16 TaxID=1520807 RepID=UPI000B8168AF|nr:SPASM domain-containing protein [Butyrivibrio sp. INlla16]
MTIKDVLKKEIYLVGDDKHVNDFLYVFDMFNNATVIEEKQIDGVFNVHDNAFLIICTGDKEKYLEIIKQINLDRGMYAFAEELFEDLDFDWNKLAGGRKIILWGIGHECDRFENKSMFCEGNNVYGYVDSEKRMDYRNGKKVFLPEEISGWRDYFVIITTIKYYEQVAMELSSYGLVEGIDYCSYMRQYDAFSDHYVMPSEMMKKAYYAEVTEGAYCREPFTKCQIVTGGDVVPCSCPPLVDSLPIGNIFCEECNAVWNSVEAKIFRLSIINRTYAFCNLNLCGKARNYDNDVGVKSIETP